MKKILVFISILFLSITSSAYSEDSFKVLKVIDGDTIQVEKGGNKEVVRLLGIDSPETVDPRKPVQCFGNAASNKLKSLILGKNVILSEDLTQGNKDKYNRLLRYVYLPNSVRTFINGEMVKQGYAYSYRQYPTKFLEKFNNFEKYARENNLGLWGSCQFTPMPTKPVIKKTTPKNIAPTASYIQPTQVNFGGTTSSVNGEFSCSGKTTCGQMTSCAEARFYLISCGVSRLDGDKDGTPCETICN